MESLVVTVVYTTLCSSYSIPVTVSKTTQASSLSFQHDPSQSTGTVVSLSSYTISTACVEYEDFEVFDLQNQVDATSLFDYNYPDLTLNGNIADLGLTREYRLSVKFKEPNSGHTMFTIEDLDTFLVAWTASTCTGWIQVV